MNILCIDSWLGPAFAEMGHQVCAVRTRFGVVDILELLHQHDFKPDLVFQQETLHDRAFLRNLDQVDCLKAYWAIDTHLNIHWHKYYTRLFDVVFTPHISFYHAMPTAWTPERLVRLPFFGKEGPFRPFAERKKELAFVGLDDQHSRPLRSRFFQLLAPMGLVPVSGLSWEQLYEHYGHARMVPNESIGFEVNFRLTEAAGAGACVLSPDVGEDQDWLYTPDKEILVYRHGLDLVEKLAFFSRRQDLAEKLGRAAWEKTRACHLPRHRAQTVLDAIATLQPAGVNPLYFSMALVQRGRAVTSPIPASLLAKLDRPDQPAAYALRLRCLSECCPGEATERAIRACLAMPDFGNQDDIALAVMGHALHQADLPLFSACWTFRRHAIPGGKPARPESLYHACLLLAETLQKLRRNFQPGLPFATAAMTPETALEALLLAETHSDGDTEWARRLALLTAKGKALTPLRIQALNVAQAASPNWRTTLDYGLACLTAYDNATGVIALRQAARQAAQSGKTALFHNILRQHAIDPVLTTI